MYLSNLYHPHTLAYHKARPLFLRSEALAATDLSLVVAGMNTYFDKGPGMASVEESALRFYLLNHLWAEISQAYGPHDVLPEGVSLLADTYVSSAMAAGQRLMYYVMLACTRESRHLYKGSVSGLDPEYIKFRDSLPSSSTGAVTQLKTNPVSMPIGHYMRQVSKVFHEGGFNSGFGGPKWGAISDALVRYLHGETSLEGFIDTAWTLEHNGGCMFNKQMLYNQNTSFISTILDVQRSGQVPHLVHEMGKGTTFNAAGVSTSSLSELQQLLTVFRSFFQDFSCEYVDWFLVEKSGGTGYSHYKNQQEQKYGPSKVTQAAKQEEESKFYVADDEYAIIYKREAA